MKRQVWTGSPEQKKTFDRSFVSSLIICISPGFIMAMVTCEEIYFALMFLGIGWGFILHAVVMNILFRDKPSVDTDITVEDVKSSKRSWFTNESGDLELKNTSKLWFENEKRKTTT